MFGSLCQHGLAKTELVQLSGIILERETPFMPKLESGFSAESPAKLTHPLLRIVGAGLFGVLAGAVAVAAIQVGVAYDYRAENPRETWGGLLWGSHHLIRIVASVLANSLASFLAGVTARSWGSVAAMVAALPAFLAWSWCAVALWTGKFSIFGSTMPVQASNADRATAVFLALVSLPLSFALGRMGGRIGLKWGDHFDSRPASILGIRWYHYLWLPLPVYILIVSNAWAAFYFLSLQAAAWGANKSFWALIHGLLSLGLIVSFTMTYHGLSTAYRTLAGLRPSEKPTKEIAKYGCGIPVLGCLIQVGVNLLHIGVERIIAWLSR
jgi:hypothetical protein